MWITAHGGALNTGRNTMKYFDTIKNYKVDAIEVDIMKKNDILYLGHILPAFSMKKTIKLDFVFDYCKQYNFKVNCDLKQKGLVKDVLTLAKRMNACDLVYFTGSVTPADIPYLTDGIVFLNNSFYSKKHMLSIDNLANIKSFLDSFKNERILGINFPYHNATIPFLEKAKELNLGLSIYTVDNADELKRLITYGSETIKNITTNLADIAITIRN
ncbi:MAG: hypothetical protein LBF12_00210 [Christensenellaceae bacterium]|jgi:hypothetical protein|nr:hypothetical protein [Christensenellaceae bacterium]